MSKSTQIELILAKIETVYGEDSNPEAALNAFKVANGQLTPLNVETAALDYKKPTFGNNEQIIVGESMKITGDIYVAGSGTPGKAPPVGVLLRGCGWAETLVPSVSADYNPISVGFESLTNNCYKDGILHKGTGCRGTFTADFTAKQVPKFSFDFTGRFVPVIDAPMPADTDYSGFITPKAAIPAFTGDISLLGVANPKTKSFTLDTKTEVVKPEWVNFDEISIVNRLPEGKAEIEMGSIAEKDWFAAVREQQKGEVLYTHGVDAGNICEVKYPSAMVTSPTYGDNQKTLTMQLTVTPLITNGNDDVLISFK
ncbi:MAG: hypothetical protein LBB65_07190 [Burkholderiales bacterium]|jgi:hypothetical protein|nr:hypothetical protein [Burkholderiales bacterium]